jgi:hypothetical protein
MTQILAKIEFLLAGMLIVLVSGCGTTTPRMSGSIRGQTYTSASGGFSVQVPVSPDLGGAVQVDNPQSVTFHDKRGTRITFTALPFKSQSSMESVLASQGREKALTEFAKRDYGSDIVVHYHADACGGTISFIFRSVTGKTGIAMFIHGERIYVVETDLLPGLQLLAQTDERSQHELEDWLENRAVGLAQTMDVK